MRLRINFAKTDAMRFTSHLDLHHTWERTFRRAGLPLAYTQGYNPHPRINLASALPLGFTGENEIVDIWLETRLPLDQVSSALHRASPPGLLINHIEEVDQKEPALQTELDSIEYQVTVLDSIKDLEIRISELLASDALNRERRGKAYNLRPLIIDLQPLPLNELGQSMFSVRLKAQPGATGRPEEVVAALQIDPISVRVHRTRLFFRR